MICGSWIAELRRREARTKTMPRWLAYTRNKVIHSSLQLNFSDSYMAAGQCRSRRNSRSFPVISPISGLTCVRMCTSVYGSSYRYYALKRVLCVKNFYVYKRPYIPHLYRAASLSRRRQVSLSVIRKNFLWQETSLTSFTEAIRRIKYQFAFVEIKIVNDWHSIPFM